MFRGSTLGNNLGAALPTANPRYDYIPSPAAQSYNPISSYQPVAISAYAPAPVGTSTKDIINTAIQVGGGITSQLLANKGLQSSQVRQVDDYAYSSTGQASDVGAGVGDALDRTAAGLGVSTSTMLLGGGLALLLLFMRPPRRG